MKPTDIHSKKFKKILFFHFCSKIRKWENVAVEKMYVVLAVCVQGHSKKPTPRLYYSKNPLPLERLELIQKFIHSSGNSKKKMIFKALLNCV
jgi:hypothetical protein